MKKLLLLALLSLMLNFSARSQMLDWVKQIGGPDIDFGITDDAVGIIEDASGNLIILGTFIDSADFDPSPATFWLKAKGETDIFILKLTPLGNFVWAKKIGGPVYEQPSGIAQDSVGNLYIYGYLSDGCDCDPGPGTFILNPISESDIGFITKLDSAGNFIMAQVLAGHGEAISHYNAKGCITVDPAGNLLTTGCFKNTVDFDPGPGISNLSAGTNLNVFIRKQNSNGDLIWAKTFSGSGRKQGNGICHDNYGNVYTIGSFSGNTDFDPGPGSFTINPPNGLSIFISKLDANGNFRWAKHFEHSIQGNLPPTYDCSVCYDAQGFIYVTGSFGTTFDFDPGPGTWLMTSPGSNYSTNGFIVKLDTAGNFIWARSIGGIEAYNFNDEEISSAEIDPSGNVYITGSFSYSADFDPGPGIFNLSGSVSDIFIAKMTQDGNLSWAFGMGGGAFADRGQDLLIDALGNVAAVGVFFGNTDFDPNPLGMNYLLANGTNDSYIMKVKQSTTNIESQESLSTMKVYPNPTAGELTIETSCNSDLYIFNSLGELVYMKEIHDSRSGHNLSDLPAGLYLLQLRSSLWTASKKLILQK